MRFVKNFTLPDFQVKNITPLQGDRSCAKARQGPKNLGSIATRKVFACPESFCAYNRKNLLNYHNTFKTIWIFPDDYQFYGWFQNCADFSRWLPIFCMILKLSGFIAIIPDYFKYVRIFPDDCQVSGWFQNCPDFSRWLSIFQIFFKTVRIFPDDFQFSGWFQNCPNFPDYCLFSGLFQNCPDLSRYRW